MTGIRPSSCTLFRHSSASTRSHTRVRHQSRQLLQGIHQGNPPSYQRHTSSDVHFNVRLTVPPRDSADRTGYWCMFRTHFLPASHALTPNKRPSECSFQETPLLRTHFQRTFRFHSVLLRNSHAGLASSRGGFASLTYLPAINTFGKVWSTSALIRSCVRNNMSLDPRS